MNSFKTRHWIWGAFIAASLVVVSGTTSVGLAADSCAKAICVEQAWTRATPGNAHEAALYFTIANNGTTDETLVTVSTSEAAQAMIHKTTMTDRVVQMQMAGDVPIPAHGQVRFAPGGYHVMLTGLKAPLKEGMSIPAKLTFASGRTLDADIPVLSVAALGPASLPTAGSVKSGGSHR